MDVDVPAVIAELLKYFPKQEVLAKRLKVSQTTISRWLNREQEPKVSQWRRVTALYKDVKGWQSSIDEELSYHDPLTQQQARDLLTWFLKTKAPQRTPQK